MKGRYKVGRFVAIGVALVGFSGISSHAGFIDILRGEPVEPQRVAFIGAARIHETDGMVERLSGIDRWTKLSDGARLQPGDIIRTTSGTAVLQMAESRSFVKMTAHTVLRLVPASKEEANVATGVETNDGFVVRSCRGKAFYVSASGKWQPVEVNQVLARGANVRTEFGAMLDLFDTQSKRPVRVPGAVRLTLTEEVLASRVAGQASLASVRR